MPGARLNSFKLLPEDMLDVSSPVRAELEFSVDGMTATGSGKSMVSVPWIGKNFGVVNFILGGCRAGQEEIPDADRRGLRLEGRRLDQNDRRLCRRGVDARLPAGERRLHQLR